MSCDKALEQSRSLVQKHLWFRWTAGRIAVLCVMLSDRIQGYRLVIIISHRQAPNDRVDCVYTCRYADIKMEYMQNILRMLRLHTVAFAFETSPSVEIFVGHSQR